MCNIIHTDFKPENVVIGLKESEIAEIAKTGQLAGSKQKDNEDLKALNMRVAGTLQAKKKPKAPPSETSFQTDVVSFEGLTAK